ncbi:MAG: AraC family transcriptional regulator [Gammaproteobacteria bacterium]|nr:AraC family transcriptional regulator [Gammaproteobacteria bacterium]
MPQWDFRRSTSSARLLAQLGCERGLTMAQCLDGTGLDEPTLKNPASDVEARQELQIVRNLQRHLPDAEGLGLDAGLRYHLTAYGIWGFALISSRSLRSAASLGMRYLDLTYVFTRLRSDEDAQEFRLWMDDAGVPPDVRQFMVERDSAAIRLIQKELFSVALPLRRVECRFPRPRYAERFVEVFGVMPLFDRPANVAVLDAAIMDLPLPQANEATAQLCEQQCRELLNRRKARSGVVGEVRDRLLRSPGAIRGMADIAESLHMTPRTLHRRLAAAGTSYRELVDEVREALAEELLRARLSVEEIAERLGYAEASSFIHAFKRWKGVPPGSLR